jgi:tRNA(Ile)-lysidine synthase
MLLEPFLAFFQRNNLPTSGCAPYLLAVSGGRDSMAMAHLFLEQNIPFQIAYCNFQLRGAESDADEAFVKAWAEKHQIVCHAERFDTRTVADTESMSIQMAARKLRYAYFERLRQIFHLDFICTAHHVSDVLETALYQFGRGAGLAGMSSIPERNGAILRPLLAIHARAIAAYAGANAIKWREDSSNASAHYARNFIRHKVVPQMEALNPAFQHSALQTVQNLQKARNNYTWFLTKHLDQAFSIATDGSIKLPIVACTALPEPTEVLRHWLHPCGFLDDQIAQIAQNIIKTGWSITAGQRTLTVNRNELILSSKDLVVTLPDIQVTEQDIMVRLGNGTSMFRTSGNHETSLKTPPDTLLVPSELLKWPLKVRNCKVGESFQPFGMDGQSQKVQDFLVNKKVAVTDKQQVRVLENGDGTFIWLIGLRSDHRFRVQSLDADLVKFTVT